MQDERQRIEERLSRILIAPVPFTESDNSTSMTTTKSCESCPGKWLGHTFQPQVKFEPRKANFCQTNWPHKVYEGSRHTMCSTKKQKALHNQCKSIRMLVCARTFRRTCSPHVAINFIFRCSGRELAWELPIDVEGEA